LEFPISVQLLAALQAAYGSPHPGTIRITISTVWIVDSQDGQHLTAPTSQVHL
jgi:hypothetical protein